MPLREQDFSGQKLTKPGNKFCTSTLSFLLR
jgi:hypothetical protein